MTSTAPLAALTTVFAPPCPTSWLVTTSKLPSQFPALPGAGATASCDPPRWDAYLSAEGFQYYSPAICPSGFEVGTSCILTDAPRTSAGFPPVAAAETVAWCVPSGHTCTSDTTDFRGGYWGVSRTATGPDVLVTVGPAIQIRFHESDLAIFETHPLTPGLTLAGRGPSPTVASVAEPTEAEPEPVEPEVTEPEPVEPEPVEPEPVEPEPEPTEPEPTEPDPDDPDDPDESADSSPTRPLSTPLLLLTAAIPPSSTTSASTTSTSTISTSTTSTSTTSSSSSTPTPTPTSSTSTPPSTALPTTIVLAPRPSGMPDLPATGPSTTTTATTEPDTPYSHTKAFAAIVSISVLLGTTLLALCAYVFFRRRRRHAQAETDSEGQTGASSSSPGPGPGPGPQSGGFMARALVLSRIPPRAWWSGLAVPSLKRKTVPSPMQESDSTTQQTPQSPKLTRTRGISPLPQLPPLDTSVGSVVGVVGGVSVASTSPESDADSFAAMHKPGAKGIPSRPRAERTSARQSWMSRLSRYMRGDAARASPVPGSPAGTAYSFAEKTSAKMQRSVPHVTLDTTFHFQIGLGRGHDDAPASALSAHSAHSAHSARLSVATADGSEYAPTMASAAPSQRGGLRDPRDPYAADSWERFARSHEGLGKLLAAKQVHQGLSRARSGRDGRERDTASPVSASGTRRSRWLSVDGGGDRLSRLSDGTFGRVDSFVSRAAPSPTMGDAPVLGELREADEHAHVDTRSRSAVSPGW